MTSLELDLKRAIDQTLTRAAQRNELKIAGTRAIALSLVTIIGTRILAPRTLLVAVAWTACAWLIVALRRDLPYRHFIPAVTTAVDAATIASFTLVAGHRHSISLAMTALVSTLFSITGAIRPQRWWIIVTTSLAIGTMALASRVAGIEFFEALLLCLLIAVAGLLGAWLARIARHAIESDVHRVVAGRFIAPQILDAGYRAPLAELTEPRTIEATILVSDIRSFTSFAETRPPAEVLAFLNEVQGAFAAIVQEHGGVVDKFMGDGMLAVFGMPHDPDAHASRAIAAAKAMAAAASRLGVKIGIGIHSGRVIAGILGAGTRLEMTVIGDTVNIASRLQALTKERNVTTLVSDTAFVLAAAESNPLVRIGPERLRGRSQDIVVYTLAA